MPLLAVSKGFDAQEATRHLREADPRLARVIDQAGPLSLEPNPAVSTFEALAQAIIHQQLNGRAARTIESRVKDLFPRRRPSPRLLLALSDESLRGAGLSRAKTLALRDLAARTIDRTVPTVAHLHRMTDEAIVERLVKVRGIGRWSAEMLLIFRLGRPDVLPVGDYGVRHGFKLVYGKRDLPTPQALARHGERWRPFRTAASWYLWRAVDLLRQPRS